MKLFLLCIYQPVGAVPDASFLEGVRAELASLRAELQESNCWVFGNGLHEPHDSKVIRTHDGETLVTDGPYVETTEHLGGVTIIKAPDLDAALEWGRRYARATTLPIEVRPFILDAEG